MKNLSDIPPPVLKVNQRGATLAISLIMLVILTLLVVSAMRSSNSNLRVAGNMQVQNEAVTAARYATEKIMSGNIITASGVAVAASSIQVTEGNATYTANVASPTCLGSTSIPNTSLNPQNPLDATCISSSSSQGTVYTSGVAPQMTGQSWCLSQQWEVITSVSDSNTGATATTHQGVSLRVPAGTSC